MGPLPVERIADFHRRLVLPVFEEIQGARRLAEKRRTVRILYGLQNGDPIADDLLGRLHGTRRSVVAMPRTPPSEQAGEWVGPTLVIAEPRDLVAQFDDPQAGIYYASVLYRIAGHGPIFVAPFVCFWMRFDGKPHGFAHRYDNDVADHPLEDVSRAQILNHALNSLTFFDLHALSPDKPW